MFGGADPSIQGLVPADIHDDAQPPGQAAPLEEGASGLRGHALDGEESLRAQERPPRGHRRQSVRAQLARRAERIRHPADGSQSVRGRARGRSSRTWSSRTTSFVTLAPASTSSGATTSIPASRRAASRSTAISSSTSAVDGDSGGSSSCWTARGTSPSATTRRSRPAPPCSVAITRRTSDSSSKTTSSSTTSSASAARAPESDDRRLERYFPGSVVRGNVLVGGNASIYPRRQLLSCHAEGSGFRQRTRRGL